MFIINHEDLTAEIVYLLIKEALIVTPKLDLIITPATASSIRLSRNTRQR
jgi:hypothetical protein